MSIYASLGVPVPIISYAILHQPKSGMSAPEYGRTMLEMQARLGEESSAAAATHAKSVADVTARQAQILHGAIASFLETPIRTDDAEIQRILIEAFEKYREQVTETDPPGLIGSWEGRIVEFAPGRRSARFARSGKQYLKALGFAGGKGAPDVHESVHVVSGARNLDVLEHIVRDRLGIYGSTHGRHIGESASFTVAAHNLVLSAGEEITSAPRDAMREAAVFFSKPSLAYDEFRASLSPLVQAAAASRGIRMAGVWQRKLGLGKGDEFVLRCLVDQPENVEPCLAVMADVDLPAQIHEAVVRHGRLLVKEILRPE
ncbi:MAG: hypothetical protein AB1428_04385 [Bacteroidota bacterium]